MTLIRTGPRLPTALIGTVFTPVLVFYLYFSVGFNDGRALPAADSDCTGFFAAIVPTMAALLVFCAWLAFQALLHLLLPGRVVQGLPLDDGTRLRYRLNGLAALVVTFAVLGAGHWLDWFSLAWVHDHFGALLSVITLLCFAFALGLYVWGTVRPDGSAETSGDFAADYFFGMILNPRLPSRDGFDFKFFCESRPSLIGWMVVNASFAVAQFEQYGSVSPSMAIVLALQLLYVADYFWFEQAILSTIDIRTERFGWMLVYGNLGVVPLIYSLQGFYLVRHVHDIPLYWGLFVVVLNLVGYAIFRTANLQKDRFRRDPKQCRIRGKPVEYLETPRGIGLLTSGFWGIARHMNYLGDWLMAFAWSLTCLFGSVVPYFYPLFLVGLLVTRERRDDRWCREKYGADWDRYCQQVRWRIVPGVY